LRKFGTRFEIKLSKMAFGIFPKEFNSCSFTLRNLFLISQVLFQHRIPFNNFMFRVKSKPFTAIISKALKD